MRHSQENSADSLRRLLHHCLWGNRADLSYTKIAETVGGEITVESERANLLVDDSEAVLAYLKGGSRLESSEVEYPQTAVQRIEWKAPFPIVRHHFGLPTLEATREGISRIAQAKVLDVISLGIDQDAQANFFHPERQDPQRRGAGGVPVRSADDYRALMEKHRRYAVAEGEARYKRGQRFSWWFWFRSTAAALKRSLINDRGWRTGYGIWLSIFYAWYIAASVLSLRRYEQNLDEQSRVRTA